LAVKALPKVFAANRVSVETVAQPLRLHAEGVVRQRRTTNRGQGDRFASLDCSEPIDEGVWGCKELRQQEGSWALFCQSALAERRNS
jgi:hypothetical protein